jgi:hypothetical protein
MNIKKSLKKIFSNFKKKITTRKKINKKKKTKRLYKMRGG